MDYDTALTAVFLEGLIFVLLAIAGVRAKLIELIPRSIMFAAGGGIGLYLAFIGLNASQVCLPRATPTHYPAFSSRERYGWIHQGLL